MSNAGQALGAAAGAVVGFFVGGPAGAVQGFNIGLLAGSALFPTQLAGVEGPRLEDFESLHADPGSPVFQVFGTCSVPGFRMYIGPMQETSTTEEVGGKGPPEQEVTTFQYFQTLGLGLCEGPINGVLRIWENGQLVYDIRPQQEAESSDDFVARVDMSEAYAETFTLYLGDEEQEADPTLELEQGMGNVPGFRGLAYIVYPDRELKSDQGQRHPAFKVELVGYGVVDTFELAPAFITSVPEWEHSSGSIRSTELNDGIVTEFTVTYDAPSSQWTRHIRTFDLDGNQLTDFDTTHDKLDGHTNVTMLLPRNTARYAAMKKGGAGSGSGISAWYIDGVLGNRPITPPVGTNYSRAIQDQQEIMYVPDHGVYLIGESTSLNLSWLALYPVVGGSPTSVASNWIEVQNDNNFIGSVAGYDDEYIYLTRRGLPDESPFSTTTYYIYRIALDLSEIVETIEIPTSVLAGDFARVFGGRYATIIKAFDGAPIDVYDIDDGFTEVASLGVAQNSAGLAQWVGPNMLYFTGEEEVWRVTEQGEAGSVAISKILAEVCDRCGVSSIDASDHDESFVPGYAITRLMNGSAAIEPLRQAGLFDIVESAGELKFPARGGATVATLSDVDLGPVEEGSEAPPAVATTKVQDVELPRQVRLRYPSIERDYEIGEQLSPTRAGTLGVNDITVELPVVLSDERAAELAEIIFREAWASRWSHQFSVDCSWYNLDPGDPVLLPVDGRLHRVRINAFNDSGLVIRGVSAVRDDGGAYVSVSVPSAPTRPPAVVRLLGDTTAVLLDLPALREEDDNAGFYVGARRTGTGSSWQGARLHRSIDSGATYSQLLAIASQAVVGTVVSAPPAGDGYTWDDSTEYVVDVVSGTLQSRNDQAVLAGANAVAVGAHGRWHLFQFANQELLGPGQYRLTRLLLGRRGTEHLIGTVEVGDSFVLVSGPGIYRAALQTSEIGAARIYRPVTNGQAFAAGADVVFTGAGQALETFSPVRVRGDRDGGGDLTISWLRRDRLSQTLGDGVSLPLSEAIESYEVDILDEYDNVVRTIPSADNDVVYSAAEQTSDFGAPQSSVTLRVYQLSATVGRGTPAEETV